MILTCISIDTCSKSWEPNSAWAVLFPCSNLCVNPWPALAKLACRDSFDWKKVRVSRVSGLCCKPNILFRMLGKAIKHPLKVLWSLPAGHQRLICPQKRGLRDQASRQWKGRLTTKAQTYITSQMQNGWAVAMECRGCSLFSLCAFQSDVPKSTWQIDTNRYKSHIICSQLARAGPTAAMYTSCTSRDKCDLDICSAYIGLDLALAWHSESTFGGWPRRKRNLKSCRYLGLERTLFYPEIPLHTAWSSRKTLLRWHMIWCKRLHLLEQTCKLWINLCQDCFLVARLPHDRTVDMAGLNLRISSRLKGRYITSQVPFAVPTDSMSLQGQYQAQEPQPQFLKNSNLWNVRGARAKEQWS